MTDISQSSDEALLRQFCAGSEDAAAQLFARYGDRLHLMAEQHLGTDLLQRVDADDIVQSVFRTFFRRAVNGDYQVPGARELWQLLMVMGMNKVRAQGAKHRAKKRDVSRTKSGDSESNQEQVPDETGFTILKMAISELLIALPEAHGQIVNLRIEGHEVGEIAAQTKRSRRTVERVLQQFRIHLHELVWPENDSEENRSK